MPIPALTALGFTNKEDSAQFGEEMADGTIRKESDGGHVMTRARFTGPAQRIITTGFTDISESDRAILLGFYNGLRGGASAFTYNHPTSNEVLTVRFKEPFKSKYAGMGGNFRWDIAGIKLETV